MMIFTFPLPGRASRFAGGMITGTLLALCSACGGSASGSAAAIEAPPAAATIQRQPASVTATAGSAVTFSVSASGTAPPAFQWKRNGAAIAGANAPGYTLPAAQLSDTRSKWSVTVTNAAEAATSAEATLTVSGMAVFAGNVAEPGNVAAAGPAARFDYPIGLAIDKAGNLLLADSRNATVRRITPAAQVSTAWPGLRTSPTGVAIDAADNLYVVIGMEISKFSPALAASTLATVPHCAGRGASMCVPFSVTVDSAGNVWVGSTSTLRKIAPDGSFVLLLGTDGATFSNTGFASDNALASDHQGGVYFVPGEVRHFDQTGSARGIAGGFGPSSGAVVDGAGNLYVSDSLNHVVRKLTQAGVVSTVAGASGTSGSASGALPACYRPHAGWQSMPPATCS